MPGRGSYGPGGKWIHDRAHRIMRGKDGTKKEYGDKEGKSVAYAIATQQAHAVKKSPKDFKTPIGVRVAKRKYDDPRVMKKTASLGLAWTMLLEKVAASAQLAFGPAAYAAKVLQKSKISKMNEAVSKMRRVIPKREVPWGAVR